MRIASALALALLVCVTTTWAAPKADLWPRWEEHDPQSIEQIEHGPWGVFLNNYLVTDHPSSIHRIRYAKVADQDQAALSEYLRSLERVPISTFNRDEQRAYWINLYNALTVKVILDHFPVDSIRDIRSGWFSFGPWDKELATVEGQKLTLNDIEHRILRPIWQDNRIHYAVNCASVGCPNLPAEPFTADNSERLLDQGARAYVNHPRGAQTINGRLTLSSIYEWFMEDFGGSQQGVIDHLLRYADEEKALELRKQRGGINYEYDWSLNAPE